MKRFWVALCLTFSLFTLVGATGWLGPLTPVSVADDLDQKKQQEEEKARQAQEAIEQAHAQMEGIDAQLGQVYVDLQKVNAQIPIAADELAAAEAQVAMAQREEAQVTARLASAETELENLGDEIKKAEKQEADSKVSIARLVRRTYRGEGVQSATELVLTGTKAAELSDLSNAAETVARLETRTLQQAQNDISENRSRKERQAALTKSIQDLQVQAQQATAQSQAARDQQEQNLKKLQDLQRETQTLGEKLKQSREEFAKAEAANQKDLAASNQKLKELDAAIRKRQEAEREAARKRGQVYVGDSGPDRGTVGGNSVWGTPIKGPMRVTSPWGYRIHPVTGSRRLHAGVDLSSPLGQQQFAVRDGMVVESYYDPGCGNMVTIDVGIFAGHRWMTRQCHLSARFVSFGQRVKRGQLIGLTGSTGRVTGPHVHFEIIRDGVSVNPMPYISN
ncbi:hypothetical protein BSR29_02335 [Boudabousia liubingyangii]|uniref:M23ase beta-sheet core domain-containing protein n=1 Tax=Boudabousia liubingyangii TaxID=1921764 RepID=A0A1Q5PQG6_9ACTO|nr:M23 family metallopeptidase [Boudabousia liubingyangii]OKL48164.1 hypothetical protein BSR28_00150 [Boudabousia liubingyangii]OKL49807.1 hypothetical protein BSR29_02335 [Boudabousia liubingyangii]